MWRDLGGFYRPAWEVRIKLYLRVDLLLFASLQDRQG